MYCTHLKNQGATLFLMELDKFGTAGDIHELLAIRESVENLTLTTTKDTTQPKIDLLDRGDAYQLLIEVSGVPQENIEVSVQDRSVTVAGLREPVDSQFKVITSERHRGHFQRSIDLPSDVNGDASQAQMVNGLLILTLPKS